MNGYSRWSVALALICALVIASVLPADAQKKKKTPEPQQQQVQQQQPVTMPSPKPTNGIREILMQYQGSQTNLGTLSKVAFDYIMLDDEGTSVYCPLHVIQSIRVTKQDEGGPKVEIKLLSKD